MDILDFIRPFTILKAIFELGYVPKKEEFYELTAEQYERYYATEGKHDSRDQKVFMLLPHDAQKYNEIASEGVYVVTEYEISYFDSAERMIDDYCKDSDVPFNSFEDKLYYAAKYVPDFCVEGTKFEPTRFVYMNKKKKERKKMND
jgi:hypothetical protein